MPGKSRHDKGKRLSQSKKSKAMQRSATGVVEQPAATQAPKPSAPGVASAPSLRNRQKPSAAPSVARYPYITAELRRIGILAGIIVIILIVLALVLS